MKRVLTTVLAVVMVMVMSAGKGMAAEPTLRELQREKLKAAEEWLGMIKEQFRVGMSGSREVFEAQGRVLESRLELAETDPQREEVLGEMLKASEAQLAEVETRMKAGVMTPTDVAAAKYAVAEIKVRIAKVKGGK